MITLRDYQEQSVSDIARSYAGGAKAPLLVAPTGSGKTTCFSHMAYHAGLKGNSVLILVHRKELLNQTSRTLSSFGIDHGLIFRAMPYNKKPVQVASVQTLRSRLDKIKLNPDLIIVDEAHHAVGRSTWGNILDKYSSAKVLGCTATPERLDGRGLGVEADGYFDDIVEGPSVRELIDAGHLSEPMVLVPPLMFDRSELKRRGADYKREDISSAMDKPTITGDAVKHYLKHCPGEPAIAFCASVKHSEHVAQEFQAAGVKAAAVDGKTDTVERTKRINDLGDGSLEVLCACDIVSEGTDIPIVSAALLLRPTQSLTLALQQMGRALRPYPGKERALILDHAGNCLVHGTPDMDREWSLAGRPKGERNGGDYREALKQCPECFHWHKTAPACPHCDHVYETKSREIEYNDGELVPYGERGLDSIPADKLAEAHTFLDFLQLAKERGARDPEGWANKRATLRARSVEDLIVIARQMGRENPDRWASFVYESRRKELLRQAQ